LEGFWGGEEKFEEKYLIVGKLVAVGDEEKAS
jgi:hypothetical protein